MPRNQQQPAYKCNLHRTGTFIYETMLLLESFAVHGSMEELKRQALEENLLGKTSSYTVKGMLRAFEQRFLVPHPPLPPAEQVALATCSSIPNVAKLHILFPYYLAADDLVRDVYLGLVLPSYHGQGQVSRETIQQYLEQLSAASHALSEWAEYTKLRWARGFAALLRDFGLLSKHPGTELITLNLRREAFAFFWLWLRQEGFSVSEAGDLKLWEMLQLGPAHREKLLIDGQQQGWWEYRRAGDVIEFHTRHMLEEWLEYVRYANEDE